jgi:predicted site-specific integrase-resolvase
MAPADSISLSDLLTRDQAAELCGVARNTFDFYRRQGRLRIATHAGRTPLFARDQVERLAAERRAGGRAAVPAWLA